MKIEGLPKWINVLGIVTGTVLMITGLYLFPWQGNSKEVTMEPRGLLMTEHRLIERMIAIIEKEIAHIRGTNKVDPRFIDTAVDFIRIYADKTHHGKEENILFRDAAGKNMSKEDMALMRELIEEHKQGRQTTAELVRAKEEYIQGKDTLAVILEKLDWLADFYPRHIKKEDDIFFPNVQKYFSDDELQAMLREFWEFDKTMIHEKYKMVVEDLESR